jgi:putative transposase
MQLEGFQANLACELTRLSRAGFYRHYQEHEPRQADVQLRDLIQQIALENRLYGYRRMTAELDHRGVVVNHKRVLRLMRADNLLAVRKQRFVLTTIPNMATGYIRTWPPG